jgi:transcriptional regulator with XRE-family HTH domain
MLSKPTKIRKLRRRYGWTQQQLGSRLGVDAVTISRWERGVSTPRRHLRRALEDLAVQTPEAASSSQMPASVDAGIDELVRIVGLNRARKVLRREALLGRNLAPVVFPVDPTVRLRELESVLRDQLDLISRAEID